MTERVRLHGMAYGGAAAGRLADGVAVFVHGGLAGETVEIEVVERKKNFARGRLVEVLETVPARTAPPCPHFLEGCGGCQWQHAGYDAQLSYKQQILADQLRRFGGVAEPPLLDPVPSPLPFAYRNVGEFHVSGKALGFNREGSHDVVDIDRCPLMEEPINEALTMVRRLVPRTPGGVTSVQIRNGAGALQVTLLCEDDPRGYKILAADLAGRIGSGCRVAGVRTGSDRTRGLYGDPYVRMLLAGRQFRVSAQSFFQVNTAVAEHLVRAVVDRVQTGERVLDLYAGVGIFGLLAAERAHEVAAVESHPSAIADAAANQAEAAAENVRFVKSDVAGVTELAAEHWDTVILDPPRAGAPRHILESLDAEHIVYVSCDPSTLARDIKLLTAYGYHLASAQLFDMFPQTYHLEVLAVLER